MAIDNDNETPTWPQAFRLAIEGRLSEMHTTFPGSIESFDKATGKATIKPNFQRKTKAGDIVDMPLIQNVPIMWPRAGKISITFPLTKGDTGAVMIHQRSLDNWLVAGGTVNPDDPRKFHLSDAAFYPGLYPFSDPAKVDDTRLLIRNDIGELLIGPDGKFQLTNGTEELLDLVVQHMDKTKTGFETLSTTTTNTIFGPLQLNDFATFATIATDIGTIKTKTETLKE